MANLPTLAVKKVIAERFTCVPKILPALPNNWKRVSMADPLQVDPDLAKG